MLFSLVSISRILATVQEIKRGTAEYWEKRYFWAEYWISRKKPVRVKIFQGADFRVARTRGNTRTNPDKYYPSSLSRAS